MSAAMESGVAAASLRENAKAVRAMEENLMIMLYMCEICEEGEYCAQRMSLLNDDRVSKVR